MHSEGKDVKAEQKQKGMLHKPNLENSLQNNWSVPFKNVKVMKNKQTNKIEKLSQNKAD